MIANPPQSAAIKQPKYITVTAVKFDMGRSKQTKWLGLNRIALRGDDDILENAQVKELADMGCKMIQIEGEVDYRLALYSFTVGYTVTSKYVDSGFVKVEKRSSKTSDADVEELYETILRLFEKYFVKP
jgi:hypothetical protein